MENPFSCHKKPVSMDFVGVQTPNNTLNDYTRSKCQQDAHNIKTQNK